MTPYQPKYPHETNWSDRLIFVPESNLDLIQLLPCPTIKIDSNIDEKYQLERAIVDVLDPDRIVVRLGQHPSYRELWDAIENLFKTLAPAGLIIQNADLLFANKSARKTLTICTTLASQVQACNTQFIFIGTNVLIDVRTRIYARSKAGDDISWLLSRCRCNTSRLRAKSARLGRSLE